MFQNMPLYGHVLVYLAIPQSWTFKYYTFFFAIIKTVGMNIHEHITLCICLIISLGCISISGIAGSNKNAGYHTILQKRYTAIYLCQYYIYLFIVSTIFKTLKTIKLVITDF